MDASSGETTVSSLSLFSSNSQSRSSKSSKSSVASQDKNKASTQTIKPIDLECKIQSERVDAILEEVIYKAKMVMCLPLFWQHRKNMLSRILSPNHFEDLTYIFETYGQDEHVISTTDLDTMDNGDKSLLDEIKENGKSNKASLEVSRLVYDLSKNAQLKIRVDETVERVFVNVHREPIFVFEGPPPLEVPLKLLFVHKLEELKRKILEQMGKSAQQVLSRKIYIDRVKHSNEDMKKKLADLTKLLQAERIKFEKDMAHKEEKINKLQSELNTLNYQCQMMIKKSVLDSERQMVLVTRAHAVKSEILKEEETDIRDTFENLMRCHLDAEKQLRAKRFKAETQLVSWLQKYDNEIGDKQAELDETNENYEEEQKLCKELERKLEIQDREYLPLMAQREAEYQQEMQDKMQHFLQQHAARVIQHCWREVLANRAEKKRQKRGGKKGEKKKKG